MLQIRAAQMQALREHAEKDFRRRLRARLLTSIPQERMNDDQIEANLEAGLRLAHDCRLTREIDIARFVEAVCVRLGGFPPKGVPRPALPILYAYGVSAERRVDRFISWCDSQHGG
jgi:hypothetical protein